MSEIDRTTYERDLRERQRKHLESLGANKPPFRPCLHDQCPRCHGTGRSAHGPCIHGIACNCSKCGITC